MEYFLAFVFGTVIGSFLNVCIYRIPRKISLVKPRSFCPHCHTTIPFYYNIPLVSYLWLRGKCHYCRQPISPRYLVVELLSGVVTGLTYWKFGLSAPFGFYLIFIYFLIVISFVDLSTRLIYNRLLIYLLGFGTGYNLIFKVLPWQEVFLGILAGGGSLFFFALLGEFLFRKESMGMGDVKLAAVLGAFLGWKLVLFALFVGFFFALVVGLVLMLPARKEASLYLPMAPFLTLGSIFFLYWGAPIIHWYWQLFVPLD